MAHEINITLQIMLTLNKTVQILAIKPGTYKIIESIYVAFAFYIFISLVFHLTRPYFTTTTACKRMVKNKATRTSEDSATNSMDDKPSGSSNVGGVPNRFRIYAHVIMTSLTVVMSIVVLIHVVVDLWAYSDKNGTSEHAQCVRHWVSGFLYVVCAFCLYGFLWIRQRAFYAHPVLKHLAKPCLIRFSWSVLATIIIGILLISVLFFLPQITKEEDTINATIPIHNVRIDYAAYGIVPRECGFERKEVFLGAHFTITLAFLYFQIALQFLFAYPIYKQRRSQSRHAPTVNINASREDAVVQCRKPAILKTSSTWTTVADGVESMPLRLTIASGLAAQDESEFRSQDFAVSKTHSFTLEVFQFEKDDPAEDVNVFHRASKKTISNDLRTSRQTLGGGLRRHSSALDQCARDEPLASGASFLSATNTMKSCAAHETNPLNAAGQIKKIGNKSIQRISSKLGNFHLKTPECRKRHSSTIAIRRQRRDRIRLTKYVIRCLCVSIICAVSDVIAFLLIYFVQPREPSNINWIHSGVTESMMTSLAYNTNVIINLLCMLACYKDWKARLCPWYFFHKEIRTSSSAK